MTRRAVAGLVTVMTMAFCSGASATTFCVHQPADVCALGTIDEGANLTQAITDAATSPASMVTVGPGRFTNGSPVLIENPAFALVGAGPALTTITSSGSSGPVLSVSGSISDLAVDIPAGEDGISTDDGVVRNVVVTGGSAGSTGILLYSASLADSTVTMASRSSTAGVMLFHEGTEPREPTVSGSTLSAYRAAIANDSFSIDHSTLIGTAGVRQTGGGTGTLDSDVIRIDGSGGNGVSINDGNASGTASETLTNVTIDGAGAGGTTTGLNVAGGTGTNDQAFLINSIVADVTRAWSRSAASGSTAISVMIDHAIVPATTDNCPTCTGILSESHEVNTDPQLVDPAGGDLHLRFSSPAIDAAVSGPQTPLDGDGLPRPVDGDANGSKRLDEGAYEYQHRAPAAAIAAPDTAAPGAPVSLDASGSSDPDHGDTLTYAWSFGDGATATGAQATHTYATPGVYVVTLAVTDPTGLGAGATHAITIAAPPPPPSPPSPPVNITPPLPPPPPPPPPAKDHTPPKVTALRISAGKLKLTLSETATVTVAEEHLLSHGHHHTVRTLKHKLVKGSHTLSLGTLAKGSYHLVVRASDAAGNRSTTHTLALHRR